MTPEPTPYDSTVADTALRPEASSGVSEVDALRESREALELLFRAASVLCRAQKPDRVVGEVLSAMGQHLGLVRAQISLPSTETEGLLEIAAFFRDGALAPDLRGQPAPPISRHLVDADKNCEESAISTGDQRFGVGGDLFVAGTSYLGVPVRNAAGVPVGTLEVQKAAGSSSPDLRRICEYVAILIGQHAGAEWQGKTRSSGPTAQERKDYGFDKLVGATPAMRRIFTQVRQVAKWNTTVLIMGESGTGKELIASAIHHNSPRARGPFIKLNCAALPDNLLESELFGHEKGAFTGALTRHTGRFEQAHRGTLFLDEIGEISPSFQAKLLRVLQEGEYERLGGTQTLRVDVRVIAATNRDLERQVEQDKFRQDLYYRLNVMPIHTPSLRERRDDIPELSRFLVKNVARDQGRELNLSEDAYASLLAHDWPGNVRELQNCLERAAVMSDSGLIDQEILALAGLDVTPTAAADGPGISTADLRDPNIDERERLVAALERAGWVQAKAARLLGMTPRQVAYRIQILNIEIPRF